MADAYNPLDKLNLGKSVVEALLESPATALDGISAFNGAGIYAIYYHGSFEPYQPIADIGSSAMQTPIYVGKAVPSGSRKGANLATSSSGKWLFSRISEHRESIKAAQNLDTLIP
jgi:Eco29kI restriction endonuclease